MIMKCEKCKNHSFNVGCEIHKFSECMDYGSKYFVEVENKKQPINDGGPAFPFEIVYLEDGEEITEYYNGMSLRDYFAAKALVALIETNYEDYTGLSCSAYQIADAMLKARGNNEH